MKIHIGRNVAIFMAVQGMTCMIALSLVQPACAQRPSAMREWGGSLTFAETVDSMRALAGRLKRDNPGKELLYLADLHPTSERAHLLLKAGDGTYLRVWANGSVDGIASGSNRVLEAMAPGEVVAAYVPLVEFFSTSRFLLDLRSAVAKYRKVDPSDLLLFVGAAFDPVRFPARYSPGQKLVLAVSSRQSLIELAGSAVADDRRAAALGLRVLADSANARVLAPLLIDADSAVSYAAVTALLATGSPSANRVLANGGPAVVGHLITVEAEDARELRLWLEGDSIADAMQSRAARTLARMGDAAVPVVVARMSGDAATGSRLMEAFVDVGDSSMTVLQAVAAGTDSVAGASARRAIERIERLRPYVPLQAREDSIIRRIKRLGPGTRYRVPGLLPEKNDCAGSIALEASDDPGVVRSRTLYPKDQLLFAAGLSGAREERCRGEGSIYRFIGEVEFMGLTITGDPDAPLTFMFDSTGFLYLHGRGRIVTKTGSHTFK